MANSCVLTEQLLSQFLPIIFLQETLASRYSTVQDLSFPFSLSIFLESKNTILPLLDFVKSKVHIHTTLADSCMFCP